IHADDKLFSTPTRYDVFRAQRAREHTTETLQHQVTGRVAEFIVDEFEVVNIQNAEGERLMLAFGDLQELIQRVAALAAGGEPGKQIRLESVFVEVIAFKPIPDAFHDLCGLKVNRNEIVSACGKDVVDGIEVCA